MENLPKIEQELVNTIFGRLMNMEVELDENPIIFGPKRLNSKIAQVRTFQSQCEALFLKVSLWVQKYRTANRAAKLALDLGKKHLFTNDPEVRSGRNLADRDAIASMKLRTEVEAVSQCDSVLGDLEAILVVIKSKKTDLKDTQTRLKDQIKLCQEEISLGSRWGNKKFGQVDKPEPKKEGHQTLKELTEMFTETMSAGTPSVNVNGTFDEDMEDFLTEAVNTDTSVSLEEPVQTPKVVVKEDVVDVRHTSIDIDNILDSLLD